MAQSGGTLGLASLIRILGAAGFHRERVVPRVLVSCKCLHLSSLLQDISLHLLPCVDSTAVTEGEWDQSKQQESPLVLLHIKTFGDD